MPKIPRLVERTQLYAIDASYHPEPMSKLHDTRLTRYISQEHKVTEAKVSKLIKAIASTAVGTVLYGATLLGADVASGIREGKEAVQDSHAEIHDIYTDAAEFNPIYQGHATFVLTGLGTKDPSKTAEVLTIHQEIGRVFGVEYSNKDLNTLDIAKRVIEKTREYHITELSFDGYSAGGPISIDVAAHIGRLAPELKIISITLNSSPLGKESLTEKSRGGVDIMEDIMSINEDLAYYKHGHIAVEVFNRNAAYLERENVDSSASALLGMNKFSHKGIVYTIDYSKAIDEIREVTEKLDNPAAASAELIRQQARYTVRSDYKNNIETLPDDVLYVYTRSTDASADQVVNVDNGEAAFVEVMQKLGREFAVQHSDVGHANPAEDLQAYDQMKRRMHVDITRKLLMLFIERETVKIEAVSTTLQNKALQPANPIEGTPN